MNTEQVQQILIEDIIPNRFQPRLTFDEKALQELAESIKAHGVIQPLVLRKTGNKYEIIAGERRYKASCLAGLKQVPAIVRDLTDDESAEIALIENVQRKNLTSIEEAQSYRNLLDRGYLTQEDLADKLGVSQSTIANKMRLLNLCEDVQNALLTEQISERHARSLLQVKDPNKQKELLEKIIKERMTVKKLDEEIKKLNSSEETPVVNSPSAESTEEQTVNNIFGIPVETPTDLEETAPNLNTGIYENEVAPSFNPFTYNGPTNEQTEEFNPNPKELTNQNINVEFNAPQDELETFEFTDFNPSNNVENISSTMDATEIEVQPIVNESSSETLDQQLEKIRTAVKNVEASSFKTEMEEYDFEDVYEIILKIKKN